MNVLVTLLRSFTVWCNPICLVTVFLSSFGVAPLDVRATAADSTHMPRVLAGVYLGMSRAQLTAAQPEVEAFEIFGEEERSDYLDLFFEHIHAAPFSWHVNYAFADGKLCEVQLLDDGDLEGFRARRGKVLQGAIKK